MAEARREWWFTLAAVFVLLALTATGSAVLMVGGALALLAVALVALPRSRGRGALAALVAACVAAALVGVLRLVG